MKSYVFNNINELKDIIADIKLGKDQYYIIKNAIGEVIDYDFTSNVGRKLHGMTPDKFLNPFYNPPVEEVNNSEILIDDSNSSSTEELGSVDESVNNEEVVDENSVEEIESTEVVDGSIQECQSEDVEQLEDISDCEVEMKSYKLDYEVLKSEYDKLYSENEELKIKFNNLKSEYDEFKSYELTTDDLVERLKNKGYSITLNK